MFARLLAKEMIDLNYMLSGAYALLYIYINFNFE